MRVSREARSGLVGKLTPRPRLAGDVAAFILIYDKLHRVDEMQEELRKKGDAVR